MTQILSDAEMDAMVARHGAFVARDMIEDVKWAAEAKITRLIRAAENDGDHEAAASIRRGLREAKREVEEVLDRLRRRWAS